LAIEKVYIYNNTSVVADEILSQRLGLIPLKGAKEGLDWMQWRHKGDPEAGIEEDPAMDYNTVVLHLDVECRRREGVDKNEMDPVVKYEHANVYAKDITCELTGRQLEYFADGPIEPVNPDILLAKLRPGQIIHLDLHCVKGIGMDHAKFSPVATATYRLLPTITITKPILGADAIKFEKCFPKGVVDVQRVTPTDAKKAGSGYEGREGDEKAVVVDAFRDTVSRECLRHDEFKDKVKLGRVQDHFIFNVESTGQFDSDVLFLESVNILKLKAKRLKAVLVKRFMAG
jgi:DNA-directed RNA polymerase I and III subunit RPAC1